MAKDGAAEGLVVVAEEQRKGKGRRGRSWASPFGLGVWVSVLLRPAIAPYDAPQAALVAALAAARAIEGEVGIEAQIKWPNDILVGGLKTAGILVEMDAELEEVRSLVIGVGINVNLPRQELPRSREARATSLMEAAGRKIDRVESWPRFSRALRRATSPGSNKGFAAILPALREKAAYLGERVEVIEAGPAGGRESPGIWATTARSWWRTTPASSWPFTQPKFRCGRDKARVRARAAWGVSEPVERPAGLW